MLIGEGDADGKTLQDQACVSCVPFFSRKHTQLLSERSVLRNGIKTAVPCQGDPSGEKGVHVWVPAGHSGRSGVDGESSLGFQLRLRSV